MFKVFNQRLAGYLMMQGFRLIALTRNDHNPLLNVFVFEKSKELMQEIKNYQNIKYQKEKK